MPGLAVKEKNPTKGFCTLWGHIFLLAASFLAPEGTAGQDRLHPNRRGRKAPCRLSPAKSEGRAITRPLKPSVFKAYSGALFAPFQNMFE